MVGCVRRVGKGVVLWRVVAVEARWDREEIEAVPGTAGVEREEDKEQPWGDVRCQSLRDLTRACNLRMWQGSPSCSP